jgi:flagellar motor switch protein FliM
MRCFRRRALPPRRRRSPRCEPAWCPITFASAGQISTDQLRAISMLNDLFARNLTHNLSAWLRTRLQVNLVSAEQITFQRLSAAHS